MVENGTKKKRQPKTIVASLLPKRKRIRVLDDHEGILEIVEQVLDYEHYEVVCLAKVNGFFEY